MKITIVYDNDVYKKDIGLKSDWGFSCLIESNFDTVLFDTGANGDILLNNMKKLQKDLSKIKNIVISHEHWDHKGGLNILAPYLKNVELYQLDNNNLIESEELINAENPKEISNNVWTTGRIKGPIDEQALIIKGLGGWFLITGCSHPGLEKILKKAEQIVNYNISGIVGGFHSFKNFSIMKGLKYICPCHCTSHKKDLKRFYPTRTLDCGVGKIIDLDVIV